MHTKQKHCSGLTLMASSQRPMSRSFGTHLPGMWRAQESSDPVVAFPGLVFPWGGELWRRVKSN